MRFPNTLPDETLFSRYIRFVSISGYDERAFSRLLFDRPRISIHPYLTIGVKKVAELTNTSEKDIYNDETLFGFYSYFIPQKSSDIYRSVLKNDCNSAFRSCQMVCFRNNEVLSLKFCPKCVQEDIREYGVSYWHRLHQVPGLEACSKHKILLEHQELPERHRIKRNLLPPSTISFTVSSVKSHQFSKYVESVLNQISCSTKSFDFGELIEDIRKYGYMRGKKRFKRKELTKDLYDFSKTLKFNSQSLLPRSEHDYNYLSRLLKGSFAQHPFKYVLLGFWLKNLKETRAHINPIKEKLTPLNNRNKDDVKKQCLELLKQKISMMEITRRTGKSQCYLKALAMSENISVNTSPRLLIESVKVGIISMAKKGFHRNAIANQFKISIGSVEQIISSVDGLVADRKRYKFESKRRKYKVQILRAVNRNPNAIKQEIKMMCYRAFHWLYLHEREWLNSNMPLAEKPKIYTGINWEERDKELEVVVREIMTECCGKISRTQLDRRLGNHGWLIKCEDKLPKTIQTYHDMKAQ